MTYLDLYKKKAPVKTGAFKYLDLSSMIRMKDLN